MSGIILMAVALPALFHLKHSILTEPMFTDDNAYRMFAGWLLSSGMKYYPNLNAGFPLEGNIYFSSAGLWVIVMRIFFFLKAHVAYNIVNLAWFCAVPLFCRQLASYLEFEKDGRLLFSVLLTIFFITGNMVLIYAGSLHWAVVSMLVCFICVLLAELETIGSFRKYLIIVSTASLAVFINPLALIPIFIFMVSYNVAYRKFPANSLKAVITALLINSIPIYKAMKTFISNIAIVNQPFIENSSNQVLRLMRFQFSNTGNYFIYPLYVMIIFCSVVFIRKKRTVKERYYIMVSVFLAAVSFIPFITGAGNIIMNINPLRMVFVFSPFVLYLAAKNAERAFSNHACGVIRRLFIFIFIAGIVSRLILHGPLLPERPPAQYYVLKEWLLTNTDDSARIMVEDAGHKTGRRGSISHPLYDSHIYPLLFYSLSRKHFIGGGIPWAGHGKWTEFWFSDGRLCGVPIEELGLERGKFYYQNYNIRWIVCWSSDAISHFFKHGEYFRFIEKIGLFHIFEINERYSFMINDTGNISIKDDNIFIDLKEQSGEIILKFHYYDGLGAYPGAEIGRKIVVDNAGFISIKKPESSALVLKNR